MICYFLPMISLEFKLYRKNSVLNNDCVIKSLINSEHIVATAFRRRGGDGPQAILIKFMHNVQIAFLSMASQLMVNLSLFPSIQIQKRRPIEQHHSHKVQSKIKFFWMLNANFIGFFIPSKKL